MRRSWKPSCPSSPGGFNSGTKGVIHVTGTVGISGVLRDKLTLYSTANVVFLDDLTYATDPASGRCSDMLGVITAKNAVIADNALNTPQRPAVGSGPYVVMDDARDFYLHAIVMTLDKSLLVENVGSGPAAVLQCGGTWIGRGCIYQTGGIIASNRDFSAVNQGGGNITGFLKQRTYDRCAINNAPPYFPTTGRFEDNRTTRSIPSASASRICSAA